MKMKSFAMLAISGLLATSFAYVSPAAAQDMNNNGPSAQSPSTPSNTPDQSSSMSPSPSSPSNDASSSGSMNSNGNMNSNGSMNSNGNMNNNNNNDEGSPDTATGDDDY